MNDELLMNNYLLVLKSTVEVFVHGTLESSNNDIRMLLKDGLNQILESQANTYDEMVNFGWYNTENVEKNCIDKVLNKINSNN